jgi:hypothetical protein
MTWPRRSLMHRIGVMSASDKNPASLLAQSEAELPLPLSQHVGIAGRYTKRARNIAEELLSRLVARLRVGVNAP